MDYKISNICSDLGIGKSTIYKRINTLKQSIPKTDWKKNEYFYYTDDNKLFFTEKGFVYIRDFKMNVNNIRNGYSDNIVVYQNQIIDIYKKRIEYLEGENKRLLDIISLKEHKEFKKSFEVINNSGKKSESFWSRIIRRINGN